MSTAQITENDICLKALPQYLRESFARYCRVSETANEDSFSAGAIAILQVLEPLAQEYLATQKEENDSRLH